MRTRKRYTWLHLLLLFLNSTWRKYEAINDKLTFSLARRRDSSKCLDTACSALHFCRSCSSRSRSAALFRSIISIDGFSWKFLVTFIDGEKKTNNYYKYEWKWIERIKKNWVHLWTGKMQRNFLSKEIIKSIVFVMMVNVLFIRRWHQFHQIGTLCVLKYGWLGI